MLVWPYSLTRVQAIATDGDTLPQMAGFLAERLMAALLEEQVVENPVNGFVGAGEEGEEGAHLPLSSDRAPLRVDFNALEARLRRELAFIGLLKDPTKVRYAWREAIVT